MNRKTLLLGASLGAIFAASAVQAQTVTGYSGDAYVIRTDESSMAPVYGDTGQLPAGGGSLTSSYGSFSDFDGLSSLSGGTSATSGGSGVANSSASVTGFNYSDISFGGSDTVSFSSVTTTSHADASGISGTTTFTNLVIDGVPQPSTFAPNTQIPITSPNFSGTLTINEQDNNSGPNSNAITVQALDFYVGGAFQINVAVSSSDVALASASTPEPGSLALLATSGLSALGLLARKRRSK